MALLESLLAVGFAAIAGLLAGVDASRRDASWLAPTLGVGVTAFAATLSVLTADGALLAAYAAVSGQTGVAVTPRELLGLSLVAGAVIAGAVLSGYGVLTRRRGPA